MHDICMREAQTKFQLSHIDDVRGVSRRGADSRVYLRREWLPHVPSVHSAVTLKIKIRVANCKFKFILRFVPSRRLMRVHDMKFQFVLACKDHCERCLELYVVTDCLQYVRNRKYSRVV